MRYFTINKRGYTIIEKTGNMYYFLYISGQKNNSNLVFEYKDTMNKIFKPLSKTEYENFLLKQL